MSLHTLANHLQSAGRGEDKMLVHMTPKEVGGLQSLAMAHGGSLTINPKTGLPEASFLRSLLPMIAGFALGPAGFQLMSAAQAGLAVGAATGLATGSLKQGLMAGLGAYGGAGLGQGLMAQGAQGAQGAAGAAGVADDVALANMQKGNVLGGVQPQPQVFGQPAVSASNTALPAYTPPTPPPVTPTYAQTQANMLQSPMFQAGTTPVAVPPVAAPPPVVDGIDQMLRNQQMLANQGAIPQDITKFGAVSYNPSGVGSYSGPSNAVDMSASATPNAAPSQPPPSAFSDRMAQLGRGFKTSTGSMEGLKGLYNAMPQGSVIASGATLAEAMKPEYKEPKKDKSLIRPYDFTYGATGVDQEPYMGSAERLYFNPQFTARTPYEAPGPEYSRYAMGGQVEQMSAMNSVGANTGYPMANIDTPLYANPMMQRPEATNVIAPSADAGVGAYSGEARFADGGISHLGDYSDGGRLLKGPGDGVSDSIPASIGNRQPARLADGEFVVPARIVSEIGNGSTEAGARKLYAMMDRVQRARRKTVGKGQVARNTKAEKLLPA